MFLLIRTHPIRHYQIFTPAKIPSKLLFIMTWINDLRGDHMAKSHYSFKKRQKELARKKKQEEKRQRRMNKNKDISEETLDQSQDQPLDEKID